jgi:3,4-dihydroxy 2-butanone 4-phosphate synthase/GTP cyclohydrolase II
MENYISPIEEIIKQASLGKMFILVDAEDRENEGDLVIPAENADLDAVNFMAKNGRGLICLTLTEERVEELGLKLMSSNNKSRHETAFTVSIEAREGVTTGISANDRALTISTAISKSVSLLDLEMAVEIVRARSFADIPVVTPSLASIETVKAVS